jgi:hypothetical protein
MIQSIKNILPADRNICQGFIFKICNSEVLEKSSQCDIIIYRDSRDSIFRDYGNTKIVKSNYESHQFKEKLSIQLLNHLNYYIGWG